MSKTFESQFDCELEVDTYADGALSIALTDDRGIQLARYHFDPAKGPAIALAILEAAGVELAPFDSATSVQIALGNLREHVGIEAAKAKAAADREALEKRRDELAGELAGSGLWYSSRSVALQRAIDRIIELENKAKS